MIYILYLSIFLSSFLFSQDDPCSLSENTVYLNNGEVWYSTTFDIGGFQWNIDGATVLGVSGGDAELAGFTVQGAGNTILGFSFTGSYIDSGCGILTIMSLDGESSGLSEIIFSNSTGQQINVNYYCDDADNDGICAAEDSCPFDMLNDYDNDGLCACTVEDCDNIENIDPCPFDFDNDSDNDGLCSDQDPCPDDPLNDDDGDGICYNEDVCPDDQLNDEDGDGICDSADSCIGQYDICGICDGNGDSCSQESNHLLLYRVAVSPNKSEMIQIINPTSSDINLNEEGLSSYYLSDGAGPHPTEPEFYYNLSNIQEMGNAWSQTIYDFFLEFPENTIIESGDTLTVAMHDNASFQDYYGFEADISLNELYPNLYYDMNQNNGDGLDIIDEEAESLILFYWDGISNTVKDVDYFLWGSDYYAVDKSDIAFAGNVNQDFEGCFSDCIGIDYINGDNPEPSEYCNALMDLENDLCLDDCSTEEMLFLNESLSFCDNCITYSVVLEEDLCDANWNNHWLEVNGLGYYPDTPKENQSFIGEIVSNIDPTAPEHYSYFRKSNIEYGERFFIGNGVTGHDETSENFQLSWEYDKNPEVSFNYGCMNSSYDNYDENATVSYGSCTNFNTTIQGIINGDIVVDEDQPATVSISGKMVSFAQTSGPWIIKITDDDGYEIEVIGYWDIHNSIINYLIDPYNQTNYVVSITGSLGSYNNKYQIETFNATQIDDYIQYFTHGEFIEDSQVLNAEIIVAPYVVIPSIGERINFMYSFPSESRVVIRIFSMDGRFITSLVDRYYDTGGTVLRAEDYSSWDGMDHLGQIVNPGTYLIHIEASNFLTAETTSDVAPIVIGVAH